MRTQEEIIARIKELESGGDFFGFQRTDLAGFLNFDNAKPFLNDDVTRDKWQQDDASHESVITKIREYMPFAWEKANNCRVLSAGRSISHMQAWLWMLGEDAAADAISNYDLYGKPQLAAICDRYGIDWEALDSGEWVPDEGSSMSYPKQPADLPFKQ